MPKPKLESWESCAPPQNQFQRRQFMDSCVEWIVKPLESETKARYAMRGPEPDYEDTVSHKCIGLTEKELKLHTTLECLFCGNVNAMTFAANPFAVRDLITVCKDCVQ